MNKTILFISIIITVFIITLFLSTTNKIIKYSDFDVIDTSNTNDHYGFWFSNYREGLDAKSIRQLQASYLHKQKPCVYRWRNSYTCVGFGLANSVFIIGKDGVIVNDTGTDTIQGYNMIQVIKKVTDLPVKYVIYGHNHIDHTGGIGAYVKEYPELEIIAHKNIDYNVKNTSSIISDILGYRSAKHAGINIPDDEFIHAGIGPHKETNTSHSTYRQPNIRLSKQFERMKLCGIEVEFMWAPSETDDELCIWLPEEKALLTNEIINPSAPSSYTLRGTKRRDIKIWIETLKTIERRYITAEYMAPTHGRPVMGSHKVNKRIREYRQGTEDMFNQTMRFMNEGLSPDEIEHKVEISPELNVPWNYFDHYNFQSSFPKAIYQNYLGHYNGDPYTLLVNKEQHPKKIHCYYARDTEELYQNALEEAKEGKKAFASQLLTHIIKCDETSDKMKKKAIREKARLYRELADKQTSSNLRNWLISDAQLLEGKKDFQIINFKVKMI